MVDRRRDGFEEAGPEEEEEAAPNVDGRKSRVFVADWFEFPGGANSSNPAQQPQPQRSVTEMTKEELAEEGQALRARLLC